jgi:WhiB family redox-sensing transcriptional regulator
MTTSTRRARTNAAPNTHNWRSFAACRETDPELFFPLGTSGPWVVQTEQAKDVCRRCPAKDLCLQWALETRQDSGVWGGLSEDERRKIHRRAGYHRTSMDERLAWQVIVETRLVEFQELEGQDLTDLEIARQMRTNAQTVKRVRAELAKAEEVAAA